MDTNETLKLILKFMVGITIILFGISAYYKYRPSPAIDITTEAE
ncbi:hypothetical protein [Halobacteriovorax marinus]|nr:hypothetical protein [Halobacteriovorax marinus]